MSTDLSFPFTGETRAALITAHPGHELCLFGWLKQARPHVYVLTDGSGGADEPRLPLTTELIKTTRSSKGSIYGRLTDARVYRAMLTRDTGFFIDLAEDLAEVLTLGRFDYVVSEAVEGYNPTHDMCRMLTGAALAQANCRSNHHTQGYEFSLIKRGPSHNDTPEEDSIYLRLDDAELDEKINTMRAHPHLRDEVNAGLDGEDLQALRNYPELAAEVHSLVEGMGPEAFRFEHLRKIDETMPTKRSIPFYERYGEMLVRSGRYIQAIRFTEHMAPIVESLRDFAEKPGGNIGALRAVQASTG